MTDLGLFDGDPDLERDIERGRRQALEDKWCLERRSRPPRCRAEDCGRPIDWLLTPEGRWTPVDLYPGPQGNVEVDWVGVARVQRVVSAVEIGMLAAVGRPVPSRYTAHWATCPAAGRFRRQR